jgi:DNA polymerase III delta subunit
VPRPDLGYFWGEDAWSIERAARDFRAGLEKEAGQTFDVWRTSGDEDDATAGAEGAQNAAGRKRDRVIDGITERLATSPMFSGGTLVVVRQPGSLLKESAARERVIKLLNEVAPGNALCFLDLLAAGGSGPAQQGALRDAVGAAGGTVKDFPALSRERMEGWVTTRASELGISLAPGAAHLLAERVGAYVREGDVDRRRMSELANGELEKLALYRPDGTIAREDIDELVAEAVPASTWAFQDALGSRRASEAAQLARRMFAEGTAIQLMTTQIHRRLRELVVVADYLAAGTKPADLVRELKMQPFRVQKLAEQARAWQQDELDAALSAMLELDMLSKGIAPDGSPITISDDRSQLALIAWIGTYVARRPADTGTRRVASEEALGDPTRVRDAGWSDLGRIGRRPGAAHQHRVGLDREGAAPLGHGQQLDQVRVEVQLLAHIAQARWKAEEELLAAVFHAEGRVEA